MSRLAAALDPWFDLAINATGLGAGELVVVLRLYVSPLTRHSGMASALLDHAVEVAHTGGARPVLDVGAGLTGAVALYESAGWTRLGDIAYTSAGVALDAHVYLAPAAEHRR